MKETRIWLEHILENIEAIEKYTKGKTKQQFILFMNNAGEYNFRIIKDSSARRVFWFLEIYKKFLKICQSTASLLFSILV